MAILYRRCAVLDDVMDLITWLTPNSPLIINHGQAKWCLVVSVEFVCGLINTHTLEQRVGV